MNKVRGWMIGLTILSLLAIGVVAIAQNRFGGSAGIWTRQQPVSGSCALQERDADGDGITNSEDPDWVAPLDGSGYGQRQVHGRNVSVNRPLDGIGYGSRHGGGQGQRGCSGDCVGTCCKATMDEEGGPSLSFASLRLSERSGKDV